MIRNSNESITIEEMKDKSYNELLKMFKTTIIITKGNTSRCFCNSDFFIKNIIKYDNYNVYHREKHMANILKGFSWYPKLLYSNDIHKILIFKNVGIPLTLQNKPSNFNIQFNQILKDMRRINVQHNDIKMGELLIDKDKKLYLCDFGWASVNGNMNCGINIWNCYYKNKPGGWYDDNNTLTRLGLI